MHARPGCNAAQAAAPTVIGGVVFSGSADGGIRAYSTKDGSLIWTFDTNRTFEAVNNVKAHGGSLIGPGAVVAGGMFFVTSGYGSHDGRGGNVLAFSVDQRLGCRGRCTYQPVIVDTLELLRLGRKTSCAVRSKDGAVGISAGQQVAAAVAAASTILEMLGSMPEARPMTPVRP